MAQFYRLSAHWYGSIPLLVANRPIYFVMVLVGLLSLITSASAQTQQPLLIAVPLASPNQYGAATFVRDDTTGVITLVPNTTVTFANPCDPLFIEPKQRFLYGYCGNGLSMYTLDPSTGIVAEVPTSPFAASIGNFSDGIVTESTGRYVYLLKVIVNAPSSSQSQFLDTFKVDPNALALVPLSSQTLPVSETFKAIAADPNGHGFAILLSQDQGGSNPVPVIYTITFDPSTGLPILPSSGSSLPGIDAQYMQIDGRGDFMAANYGQRSELITVFHLSTTNFQTLASNTFQIPDPNPNNIQRGFFFDPSGGILYVQYVNTGTGNPSNFHLFDTGTLLELPSSPLPITDGSFACGRLDPYGPFSYCATGHTLPSPGISVFQIDPITGIPSQAQSVLLSIPNSAFLRSSSLPPLPSRTAGFLPWHGALPVSPSIRPRPANRARLKS